MEKVGIMYMKENGKVRLNLYESVTGRYDGLACL